MKDIVIIDKNIPQYKGNFHMHTARSWDSQVPLEAALAEYREKGYQFCVVTDHEVYFDSKDYDTEDFIALSGVESAFVIDETKPTWLMEKEHFTSLHINLIHDMTKGANGFRHDQVLKRPVDLGLSSWNRYIDYLHDDMNQITIINHPNWSRLAPEIFMGIHRCFAFEIWNSDSVIGGGCRSDEDIWDYSLKRGNRILALTGDDVHKYGPEHHSCGGGFTMLSTNDFSREGLVKAIKAGKFYPSIGPRIYDMRVTDGILHMEFDPALSVRIVGGDLMAKGFIADREDEPLTSIDWKVKAGLKYFRVEIRDLKGRLAWSQPVFPDDWNGEIPELMEDPHTAIPEYQKGWQ